LDPSGEVIHVAFSFFLGCAVGLLSIAEKCDTKVLDVVSDLNTTDLGTAFHVLTVCNYLGLFNVEVETAKSELG